MPADGGSRRGSGSSGFFGGFAPWIVYWVLSGNVPFAAAIGVALALSVALNLWSLARHRTPKVLEVGNSVAFVVLGVIGAVGGDAFVQRWIQPLGNAALLGIMLASVAIGKPFVLQYVGDDVSPEQRETPGFRYVASMMTWVWVAAMTVMTVSALVPPIVQGDATMADGGTPLSIVCYWVIPFTTLGAAMVFSALFPGWLDVELGGGEERPTEASPPLPGAVDTSAARSGSIVLRVIPEESLLDAPVGVSVAGASPGDPVELRLTTVDALGQRWRSVTAITADDVGAAGTVALDDPTSPIWSMAPPTAGADLFVPPLGPSGVAVEARIGGGMVLSEIVVRRAAAEGVVVTDVSDDRVVGRLVVPPGAGPFPGVVLFSGSEGGLDSNLSNAGVLASHGFVALIAGYVGVAGRPDQLVDLPLERFVDAARWLSGHELVGGEAVGVYTGSKGAEGVLSALARCPDAPIGAAALFAPSAVAWQAMGEDGAIAGASTWTWEGTPVPWLRVHDEEIVKAAVHDALRDRGRADRAASHVMRLLDAYERALADAAGVAAAAIPVERIQAPLLLMAGDADELWPSERMATMVRDRRRAAGTGSGGADELAVYADHGHLLRLGLMPTTVLRSGGIAFGGTAAGTAAAQADATQRVVSFLRRHL